MMIRRTMPPRFDAGFTLLEMMLAVAILAIVLVMLSQSFHTVAMSKVQGENSLALDREGRGIIWRLGDEFQNTVQTPIYPSDVMLVGTAQMQNDIPIDSVSLSTFGAGHERALVGFGAEQLVTYTTSPNPDHPGWFVLTRSQMSALLTGIAVMPKPPPALIVAANLVSLHLRYFNGTQWVESWNSTQMPRNQQLPLAVSINLELADAEGHVRDFATEVDVPMAQPLW